MASQPDACAAVASCAIGGTSCHGSRRAAPTMVDCTQHSRARICTRPFSLGRPSPVARRRERRPKAAKVNTHAAADRPAMAPRPRRRRRRSTRRVRTRQDPWGLAGGSSRPAAPQQIVLQKSAAGCAGTLTTRALCGAHGALCGPGCMVRGCHGRHAAPQSARHAGVVAPALRAIPSRRAASEWRSRCRRQRML